MLDTPNTQTYLAEKEHALVSRVATEELDLRGGGALGRVVIERFIEAGPEEWRRATKLLTGLEGNGTYPASTSGRRTKRLQSRLHDKTASRFSKLVRAMPPDVNETSLLRLLLLEELQERKLVRINQGKVILLDGKGGRKEAPQP